VPFFGSTLSRRRASSASAVDCVNGVSCTAREPKPITETLSEGALVSRKARAAASASSSFVPAIERERSMAITTLLVAARLTAWRPTTRLPFSVRVGGAAVWATGATTVTRTVG
jgi:hypothetical protein